MACFGANELQPARYRGSHFRVKPKDHSDLELEHSFNVAVASRKQEKEKEEKEKAVKSRVNPGKKRRKSHGC